MAYECFVMCERDGCNSRVQVPQVTALPQGWVALQYSKVKLNTGPKGEIGREQVVQVFCSWKCLMHHAKAHIRGDENS